MLSSRAMKRRTTDRCPRCVLRTASCVCALLPRLELATRLVVVMHWREANTTSNTGRIACLALPNSELRLRGREGERDAADGIGDPSRRTLVLFPTEDAVELTPDFRSRHPGPYTLVVPDGTWRQAKKVVKREPSLAGALRVRLSYEGTSTYYLRRAPNAGALSTMEAIARALGILENVEARERLESLFGVVVERSLSARRAFMTPSFREP